MHSRAELRAGIFIRLLQLLRGLRKSATKNASSSRSIFSLARNLSTWHSFRNTISNSCGPAARRSAKMAAQRKVVFLVSALPSSARFRNSSPSILTSSFRRAAIQHFRRSSSRASSKSPWSFTTLTQSQEKYHCGRQNSRAGSPSRIRTRRAVFPQK